LAQISIPIAVPVLGEKEMQYVMEAVRSGWISSVGGYVTEFEKAFSTFCEAKHGVATSSGTTALHLAIASLGIGPNDEVIIPALTMIASANSVTYTGARSVLVDSELDTWNIDVSKIEAKVTSRTKAIMAVHTYGHPADMDSIMQVARDHDLYVIEDAAEAHGAEYKSRRVGAIGNMGCFSFYANKIITTGEGGMIVTNSDELAEKARLLRDQAYEKQRRFLHKYVGFNYRLTNVQAAIGLAQFDRINEFVGTRRRNAHTYNTLLRDVTGVVLPPEARWAKNVYWMYSVLLTDEFGMDRDTLATRLREQGVDTRPFFYPIHLQPAYSALYEGENYPVAEKLSKVGMNLPSGNGLSEEQVIKVCEAIKTIKSESKVSRV
jgi:perosamine synthetase